MDICFREAIRQDLETIVQLLADDPLGATREDGTLPLKETYLDADRARASGCFMI